MGEGRGSAERLRISGGDPYLIELPGDHPRLPAENSVKAFLFTEQETSTICLLGLSEDFRASAGVLLIYLHPVVSRLFLGTAGMRLALKQCIGGSQVLNAEISGYTANVLCDGGKRVKTRREWFAEGKPPAEFFSELEQEKQWLRSLEVTIDRDGRSHCRIKRDLTFSCQAGLTQFYTTLLAALGRVALDQSRIFQSRGAEESTTRSPRPVEIRFENPVFDSKAQNARLVSVLRRMSDSALSVFHANPFMHASVVDYLDGSSYRLWITDSSAITLIPDLRASATSLGRLCNHINEYFEEGLVQEIAE
jgi:hypothetical protein